MTRLWSDGAEFGDTLFWDSATLSASTTQKRTGAYSYYTGVGGAGVKNLSDLSEFYLRLCPYIVSPAGTAAFVQFRHGTTVIADIRVNAGATALEFFVNNVSVDLADSSITLAAWHLVEIHFKMADAGVCQIYQDGILVIDYSGDTKPGADTHIDNINFKSTGAGVYFDDLGLDDATYCGDGHIELLTPNNNGDTNNWTGSDGDSVNNYALVDDIPATGDDYVKSNTALQQDMYNLTDFTGTDKVITRVWPECRAKDNDATAGQIKLGMKTASTHLGSAISLSGSYARVVGDEETTNPADGTAWEDADLDSIQFVVECE